MSTIPRGSFERNASITCSSKTCARGLKPAGAFGASRWLKSPLAMKPAGRPSSSSMRDNAMSVAGSSVRYVPTNITGLAAKLRARKSMTSTGIGAAPLKANSHASSPTIARSGANAAVSTASHCLGLAIRSAFQGRVV